MRHLFAALLMLYVCCDAHAQVKKYSQMKTSVGTAWTELRLLSTEAGINNMQIWNHGTDTVRVALTASDTVAIASDGRSPWIEIPPGMNFIHNAIQTLRIFARAGSTSTILRIIAW